MSFFLSNPSFETNQSCQSINSQVRRGKKRIQHIGIQFLEIGKAGIQIGFMKNSLQITEEFLSSKPIPKRLKFTKNARYAFICLKTVLFQKIDFSTAILYNFIALKFGRTEEK
ncbi:hypothetical protein BO224_07105 [Erysipelotrichaceae bacterium NYU-BL-E8]|uniref:Uncharacterized protein n=1 Tax=Ileibacterium valens TaxID=1862668 RepID=A0A1U7NFJ0_9FIRM|nr:hypothetical protein BM735_08555 [Erysipelotrichaceae bacterium NYU-BL-F16]OLU39139.1 hypothetical protein BO222_07190 [Ileibacterium valens]OLU39599.1 hypothetical protein BO224_07105 [Erysipelotrichaceae bacterium NYU-BL-E8]